VSACQLEQISGSALSDIILAVVAHQYLFIFQLHVQVRAPVFLVLKIDFEPVIAIAFIDAGMMVRVGNVAQRDRIGRASYMYTVSSCQVYVSS
jgi:hypothetical protein